MNYFGIVSFAFGIYLILATPLLAQTNEATQILQRSQQKLESLQDFSSEVLYVISNPNMPKAIPKTGQVKFKEGKYALVLSDQEIYCDLESIWVYLKDQDPDNSEVSVMDYDPDESPTLESIFSVYKTNSTASLQGSETVKGRKCHKIFLINNDKELDYNEANVWIDEENLLLTKASLIDRKKTTTTFEFSNIQMNVGFPDSDFQLSPSQLDPSVPWYDER